jgi:hypothetical protein
MERKEWIEGKVPEEKSFYLLFKEMRQWRDVL